MSDGHNGLGSANLSMPHSLNGGLQSAIDGVSNHDSGATDQTVMENLSLQSGNAEPLELITALGVFDPDRVFASALDIGFQDQWVRL